MFKLQRLALPLILGQLALSVNGFTTHYFLSRSSGVAFHASLPGSMLAIAIASLFVSTLGYSGTLIAQRHGAGDENGADSIFRAALLLCGLSLPLFVLAAPLAHLILGVFDTEPAVLRAESEYCDLLLVNGVFTLLATVLGGYFTGRGRTRFVGLVTVSGFLLNIALSYFFILDFLPPPFTGVFGAGCAATIARMIPCAVLAGVILVIRRRGGGKFRAADFRDILAQGFPNGIRSCIDIGGFFVFVALLAECPAAAVAASTAAFAINGLFQACTQGLAAAVEITIARNLSGAPGKNRDLVDAVKLVFLYIGVFAAILLLGGRRLFNLFLPNAENFDIALFHITSTVLLPILGFKALTEALTYVLQSVLKGRGETLSVFKIQFSCSCLFWIPAYLLLHAYAPSVTAYWLSMFACSTISVALLAHRLRP